MPCPPDHALRMQRTLLALDGLSIGDAFGQRFFGDETLVVARIDAHALPSPPWRWTDDTAMALSIVEVLDEAGAIEPDRLAAAFVRRYREQPNRGYGGGAHHILQSQLEGVPWPMAARSVFAGEGSKGNGAAMRVAPL